MPHPDATRSPSSAASDPLQSYALGIDEIDNHHRTLLAFIDQLEQAIRNEAHWLALHDILDKLHRWAEVHFAVEESLMQILGYPELEMHRRAHQTFIVDIRRRRENVVTNELTADTAAWLRKWLQLHIGIDDRNYAEFFRRVVGEGA
ncbi:MAG: bacteriohemerythrin [Rhodocyclaceae bacterium]|nr:MAG: bacteriohemerythrin [Rhodocyclaceae bacterium]